MADKYKLVYFDVRGRAEPVRMMFAMAHHPLEDVRLTREEWTKHKPDTKFGIVPYLETAQGTLIQSPSIYMFVASKLGFEPEDMFEKSQADAILLTINDVLAYLAANVVQSELLKIIPSPPDIDKKIAKGRELMVQMIDWTKKLSKAGHKYIHGDKITVSDIGMLCMIETFQRIYPDLEESDDWLKELLDNVRSEPRMAQYLKDRK